jgi:hypothetical protein
MAGRNPGHLFSSYAGLTRLRGRSPFVEAKARVSIMLRKESFRSGWMAGSSPAMTMKVQLLSLSSLGMCEPSLADSKPVFA